MHSINATTEQASVFTIASLPSPSAGALLPPGGPPLLTRSCSSASSSSDSDEDLMRDDDRDSREGGREGGRGEGECEALPCGYLYEGQKCCVSTGRVRYHTRY